MRYFYLDYETRSELNLARVGAHAYCEHPSTEVICCAVGRETLDCDVGVYTNELDLRERLDLVREQPDTKFVAHNSEFERQVTAILLGVNIPIEFWVDTAALAAGMSLPRDLRTLSEFFWPDDVDSQKMAEGKKLVRKFCQPNRDGHFTSREEAPEDFVKFLEYCKQDARVLRRIHQKLLPLSEAEESVRLMTERMNARGLSVDLDSLRAAREFSNRHYETGAKAFREAVGCSPKSPKKVAQFFDLLDAKKSTLRHAARDDNRSPEQKRLLDLRLILAKNSAAKLTSIERHLSKDSRLRGAFIYGGAERTRRWSSTGAQLQNMARGLGEETDTAFSALHSGLLEETFVGRKMDAPAKPLVAASIVPEMLRGLFVGPFLVADYSQIEARFLAWLAGQKDLIDLYVRKEDPYCAMATRIYGRAVTKKEKDLRFTGKQAELGCGYGQGHQSFVRMLDETYDYQMEPELARKIVKLYRQSHQHIVKFWGLVEAGFRAVLVKNLTRTTVGPLHAGTQVVGDVKYVYLELPSGRRIYYADASLKGKDIRFFGRDNKKGGAWGYTHTYGGKLVENVVQAGSRDVLAEGMLRIEAAGYEPVMTVHDEVVVLDRGQDLAHFKALMEKRPQWALDCPIEAECFRTYRYRK